MIKIKLCRQGTWGMEYGENDSGYALESKREVKDKKLLYEKIEGEKHHDSWNDFLVKVEDYQVALYDDVYNKENPDIDDISKVHGVYEDKSTETPKEKLDGVLNRGLFSKIGLSLVEEKDGLSKTLTSEELDLIKPKAEALEKDFAGLIKKGVLRKTSEVSTKNLRVTFPPVFVKDKDGKIYLIGSGELASAKK